MTENRFRWASEACAIHGQSVIDSAVHHELRSDNPGDFADAAEGGNTHDHHHGRTIPASDPSTSPVGDVYRIDADRDAGDALRKIFACIHADREFLLAGQSMSEGGKLPPCRGDTPCFQVLTAGSEGCPKRLRRSQASWIASFEVNRDLWSIGPSDRVAVVGHLSHTLSSYAALEALHLGAALHLLAGTRPDRQLAQLKTDAVSVLYATPTQLRLLAAMSDRHGETSCPELRLVLSGGAKLDPSTRKATAAMFPCATIREFYGSAETSFISVSDSCTPVDSVGRPYRGVEIDIRCPDDRSVAPGESGSLWVASPYMAMLGPDLMTGSRSEFWRTGEIGHVDHNGYLFLHGRRDRMIRIAEHSLHPEAMEAYLLAQPGVQEAAILTAPDRLRGMITHAFVFKNCRAASDESLHQACRRQFGNLLAPASLCSLDHWPRLPAGKTDMMALRCLLDMG